MIRCPCAISVPLPSTCFVDNRFNGPNLNLFKLIRHRASTERLSVVVILKVTISN